MNVRSASDVDELLELLQSNSDPEFCGSEICFMAERRSIV
jgi:hypothetical protein